MTRRNRLAGFLRDTEGSYSIESLLVLPMLIWALLACFSFFDGLRQANVNIKAAHTIGDLLSREGEISIDPEYMDGIHDVLRFLVQSPTDPRLRVSVVEFDGSEDAFELVWSRARGGIDALTEIDDLVPHLPDAAGGRQLIVVETRTDYEAPFTMGLSDTTLSNLVVIKPRFAPTLTWNDGGGAA